MKTEKYIKFSLSSVGAYVSVKLGILFPILCVLLLAMVFDYLTGMLSAGYNNEIQSRKGMWGVIKKAMYAVVVAVAMIADWVIINVAEKVGIAIPLTTFFGLLVAIWLIFNELISILENLIKMDVPIPSFLKAFVSKFKIVIEGEGNKIVDNITENKSIN